MAFFSTPRSAINPSALNTALLILSCQTISQERAISFCRLYRKEKPRCRQLKWPLQHPPQGCREAGNGGQLPRTPAPGVPSRSPAAPNPGQTPIAQNGLLDKIRRALMAGGLKSSGDFPGYSRDFCGFKNTEDLNSLVSKHQQPAS